MNDCALTRHALAQEERTIAHRAYFLLHDLSPKLAAEDVEHVFLDLEIERLQELKQGIYELACLVQPPWFHVHELVPDSRERVFAKGGCP